MKLYIKKTAIVFLIISFILSSINISAFKTYSKEINETDIIVEETDILDSENSDESEVDKLETDESEIDESKSDELETEGSEINDLQTDKSSKEDKTDNEFGTEEIRVSDESFIDDVENDNNSENIEDEDSELETIKYSISAARINEEIEGDFTYYYANNNEEKYSCSYTEINDVIKNATGDMIIELNRDIKMQSSVIFEYPNNYTLDLKSHILTVENGFQAVRATNKDSIVTIKNGTIKGANANSGGVWYKCGAGIFCRYGTLIIENMTITENVAEGYGGGISLNSAVASIINCEVSNNEQTNICYRN